MKLMTKELEKKFERYPYRSQQYKGKEAKVIVKYFNPMGAGTWLITEGEKVDGEWHFFGYCHIAMWEWGWVTLKELENLRLPLGLSVERDLHIGEATVDELS